MLNIVRLAKVNTDHIFHVPDFSLRQFCKTKWVNEPAQMGQTNGGWLLFLSYKYSPRSKRRWLYNIWNDFRRELLGEEAQETDFNGDAS